MTRPTVAQLDHPEVFVDDPTDCGWHQSAPGQIHPGTPGSGGTPGSYCPSSWEESFDRSEMSTSVAINNQLPQDVPTLRFIFPADAGAVPPSAGEMTLNGTQEAATRAYFNVRDDLGKDTTIWLRYLHNGSTISYATLAATKESRSYQVTGEVVVHPNYVEVPITWTQGTTAVPHGPVDVTLGPTARVPEIWEDAYGVDHYGRISFSRTDLINTNRDLLPILADRILKIRASNSVPRLASVTLDARQGPEGHTASLMSRTDPGRPSRYQCCLQVGGRTIYNQICFASSVRHVITRSEWTTRIGLDVALWAGLL